MRLNNVLFLSMFRLCTIARRMMIGFGRRWQQYDAKRLSTTSVGRDDVTPRVDGT